MSAVSRRIDFEDEALVIRFDGLDAFTRLTRKVRIPYTAIGSVSIGLTDPPGLLAVKVGLSTPPFGTTQRGRFREHGRWSFLDVNDRERAVVLDLTGSRVSPSRPHRGRSRVLRAEAARAPAATARPRRRTQPSSTRTGKVSTGWKAGSVSAAPVVMSNRAP